MVDGLIEQKLKKRSEPEPLLTTAELAKKVRNDRRRRIDGAGFCLKLFYAGGQWSSVRAIPLPTGRCSS